MKYLLDRLSEPSTWRGAVSLATAVGVKLRPDLMEAIISAGLAVMGIINVLRKEKNAATNPPVAQ
jgi:hypothetical protein